MNLHLPTLTYKNELNANALNWLTLQIKCIF